MLIFRSSVIITFPFTSNQSQDDISQIIEIIIVDSQELERSESTFEILHPMLNPYATP
jgi:hypothetical protein